MINNKNRINQLISQLNSKKLKVNVYNSLENMSIVSILKMSGYIKIINIDVNKRIIKIEKLKTNIQGPIGSNGRTQYKSISKPGRRIYKNKEQLSGLNGYKQGLGETLLRTSKKGIIKNTGISTPSGEILLKVF